MILLLTNCKLTYSTFISNRTIIKIAVQYIIVCDDMYNVHMIDSNRMWVLSREIFSLQVILPVEGSIMLYALTYSTNG